MDRVSGWYRRRTQIALFALGLLAAAVLNIDPLTVGQRLYQDQLLRSAVAAQADTANDDAKPLPQVQGELQALGLPIGWNPPPQGRVCDEGGACATRMDAVTVLGMLAGWLITAFAVTLGAPFWFDVLNRVMVIRSTVKPREKSPEEGSEDRRPVSQAPSAWKQEGSPPLAFEPHEWSDGDPQRGRL